MGKTNRVIEKETSWVSFRIVSAAQSGRALHGIPFSRIKETVSVDVALVKKKASILAWSFAEVLAAPEILVALPHYEQF